MAWVNLGVAAIGAAGAIKTAEAKSKTPAGAGGMGGMGFSTDARAVDAIFDNSGWNVSFGNSKIDSTAEKSIAQTGPNVPNSPSLGNTAIGQPANGGQAQMLPGVDNNLIYAALGAAVLIAWKKKQ